MNQKTNPTFVTDYDPAVLPLRTMGAVLLAIVACGLAFSAAFVSPIVLCHALWPKAMPIVALVETALFCLGQPPLFDALDGVERRVVAYMAKRFPPQP